MIMKQHIKTVSHLIFRHDCLAVTHTTVYDSAHRLNFYESKINVGCVGEVFKSLNFCFPHVGHFLITSALTLKTELTAL